MAEKFLTWGFGNPLGFIAILAVFAGGLTALVVAVAFAAPPVTEAIKAWRRKNGTNGEHTGELRKDLAALGQPPQHNSDPLRLVTHAELSEAIEGVRRELRAVIAELTASRERLAVKVEALPGEIRREFTEVLEGWLEDSEKRSAEVREQLGDVLAAHGIIERRKVNVPVAVERRKPVER